jgi:4-hydroxy-tetrahydrodipicolinate synthase
MKGTLFSGSAAALATPFCGGKIDYPAFSRLIEYQLDGGSDALVICGTTGEAATLTADERDELLSFAVMQCAGRVPVIAGTGGSCTAEVVRRCERAQQLGADALLIVTPYYNKASQNGLISHYGAAADAVDLPILLYNVPSRTGVNLLPETVLRLSEHPNICGIKEASGDISQAARLAQLTRGQLDLYAGNDDQTLPMLSLGARGVISAAANVIPHQMHALCRAWFDGNTEYARDIQLSILPLCRLLFAEVNPIPVKAALHMLGLCRDEMRLPLTPLSDKYRSQLKEELKKWGK